MQYTFTKTIYWFTHMIHQKQNQYLHLNQKRCCMLESTNFGSSRNTSSLSLLTKSRCLAICTFRRFELGNHHQSYISSVPWISPVEQTFERLEFLCNLATDPVSINSGRGTMRNLLGIWTESKVTTLRSAWIHKFCSPV